MRIAQVTAGSVGLGHLVCADAIRRGLLRAGFKGEFRLFGPPSYFATTPLDWFHPVPIVPEELADPFRAEASALGLALAQFKPDLLIGETHWAPLLYLLPLGCPAWLLLRKVPDIWFTGTEDVPFNPDLWDRIIGFEPGFMHHGFTDYLDAIVICNPGEQRPAGSLRQRLEVPEGKRLVVVVQAGERGEAATIEVDQEPDAWVVRLDGRDADYPYPLAEWLADADQIYAGAGYNAYWESKWLGWFDRTRFTAFERRIDDQPWRLRECAGHWPRENGADQLARWMLGG